MRVNKEAAERKKFLLHRADSQSARCDRQEAYDGVRVKRQSDGGGREDGLFTDKRADTWSQSAGRWEEANRTVSSRDGAACHDLSRATRTPGSKKKKASDHLHTDYIGCPDS